MTGATEHKLSFTLPNEEVVQYVLIWSRARGMDTTNLNQIQVNAIDITGKTTSCTTIPWLADTTEQGYSDCGSVVANQIEMIFDTFDDATRFRSFAKISVFKTQDEC